jgi:hypothetical protein
MATERKRVKLRVFLVFAAVVFVGLLAYFSMKQTAYQYEVCVPFRGTSHCSTASGASADEAIRAAHDIDCSQLANGRDQNMVCLSTDPSSVRQISGPH